MHAEDIPNGRMVFASCNICGSDEYREICGIEINPTMVPSKLVKCKRCGLFYANPRLNREAEEDYYKVRYLQDIGKNYWYGGRINVLRKSLREMCGFFEKSGRLIDVGCGMGYFMDLARGKGWETAGVEISDLAVDHAREELGLDVRKGNLGEAMFEKESFDAATMWNVLDQLYDPRGALMELNRMLKKGGYLFIRVQNNYFHLKLYRFSNVSGRSFKNFTDHFAIFHPYSFNKDSIKRLLESTGFSGVIVKPESVSLGHFFNVNALTWAIKILMKSVDLAARIVFFITLGRIVISPSIFVIAKKAQ